MKKLPHLLLASLFCLVLGNCGRPKPSNHELRLLPDDTNEKYWFFQEVLWNGEEMDFQMVLLSRDAGPKDPSTSMYVANWTNREKKYRQGARRTSSAAWSKPGKWPLSVRFPADSMDEWRLHMDHRSFWMDAGFKKPKPAPIKLRARSYLPDTLPCPLLLARPGVYAFESIPIKQKNSMGDWQYGYLQGACFENPGELLQNKATYFLQLLDKQGRQSTFLFSLQPDGSLERLLQWEHNPDNGWEQAWQDEDERWRAEGPWTSPESQKTYSLRLQGIAPYYNLTLRPLAQDQEQSLGRASFWMGAVGLGLGSGPPTLYGTMIVFAP